MKFKSNNMPPYSGAHELLKLYSLIRWCPQVKTHGSTKLFIYSRPRARINAINNSEKWKLGRKQYIFGPIVSVGLQVLAPTYRLYLSPANISPDLTTVEPHSRKSLARRGLKKFRLGSPRNPWLR